MKFRNTEHSYGVIAKSFHWIIALLVIGMIFLGFFMGDASSSTRAILYTVHKSTGLTILLLMILRLCWRAATNRPALPKDLSKGLRGLAGLSHFLMYCVLFCLPLSGWVMSTAAGYAPNFWWLIQIPAPWVQTNPQVTRIASDIHEILAWAIVALATIHVLAAIWHHWVRKDSVLKSMIPCHKSF